MNKGEQDESYFYTRR
ncbi:Protein of unknown function [Lactobacillus helveticus CIRM-BIA 953]|uniref:Uncharacterized protein n=1 Tax=Lactobacillus helveticus CIRM-BIA 953 TaxID=1226335 RepID=U4QNQ8_LACHE|nr:Protein of unknown function [Lactobacillus helveticus CIRM-BIA 953]